jgi:hypothetical protein
MEGGGVGKKRRTFDIGFKKKVVGIITNYFL